MSHAVSPMRMNAALKRADSPAMRTSHASASANPPPAAGPRIAAINGCGARRIATTRSLIRRCDSTVSVIVVPSPVPPRFCSLRSSPARFLSLEIDPRADRAPRAFHYDDARLRLLREPMQKVFELANHLRAE